MHFCANSNSTDSNEDTYNGGRSRYSYLSDCTGTKPKFKFPPPPRITKSENNSYMNTSLSDSSNSSVGIRRTRKNKKRGQNQKLPPMGIFWDIENCQVPKNKSASAIVQRIRHFFLNEYREADFIVVCDVKKENSQIVQEIHDSQVNLLHVSSLSKNAADEKLRQSMRRFAEVYSAPAAIVLISSDINFAADLSDLRFRKKIKVILVHNVNVADALILCADEHYVYSKITEDLPLIKDKGPEEPAYLLISNLPLHIEKRKLKNRLKFLTDNCGGRVQDVAIEEGSASVRFLNAELAKRAERRIQGEDVFGNKIKVLTPTLRNYAGQKVKNRNRTDLSASAYNVSSSGFTQDQPQQNYSYSQCLMRDSRRGQQEMISDSGVNQDSNIFRPIRGMGTNMGSTDQRMMGTNMSSADLGGYDSIWGQRRNNSSDRRPRTPQDSLSCNMQMGRIHKISGSSEYSASDDGKPNQPVDLVITNLDATIEIKELKRLLTNMLKEYAMILSLNIIVQADGTPVANIKVNSQQEAQFAISQLHRQRLGHKRIVISYAQNNTSPDPEQLRAMVVSLLQEVPGNCMPLFKLIELVEHRYHCTISVSEINKLKDICKITDDLGSRIISLTQEIKMSPPSNLLNRALVPYCTTHFSNGMQGRGWCELSTVQTPNIMMSLVLFTSKLNSLLNMHLGSMPLLSFQACYEQEFHEALPVDDRGVPLEHLITCVQNVEIKYVGINKNIKYIKKEFKAMESDEEAVLKIVPPSLAPNITLLCRELVDLLKTTDKCQLLLSKFIPAYHHHFGRQCRVADYGYTKLLDLFESISHVVQIMGDGTRRTITLCHSAQMRRFTSDLLRVLKVQPSKQMLLTEFPAAYEKVINKAFNAVEYGLCTFEDLLEEMPEHTIVINHAPEGIIMAVPKREQTAEEVMRTKQFSIEVIDLLRHSPYCSMLFNKFVPAYHHHFGHQCKVSDYGFTKLIELFEAIPDIVKIEEMEDGERTVSLTLPQLLSVLGSQIGTLIKNSEQSLLIDELPIYYLREFGYPLKPNAYECDTISEVIQRLGDYVQVIESNAGRLLVSVEVDSMGVQKVRTWALLLNPPYRKEFATFKFEYQSTYNSNLSMTNLQQLQNVISLSSMNDMNYISLTALYILGAQLYHILYNNGGSILFNNLEQLYLQYYSKILNLSDYNINSIDELYNQFSFMLFIRGTKKKIVISLNRNLAEHAVPLPRNIYNPSQQTKRENVQWPPPPPPELLPNASKKVSPPKPDTPPAPGVAASWNHWGSPSVLENYLNLSIQMPIVHNPTLLGNSDHLISPAKHLMPSRSIWESVVPMITAPDPTELPIPEKLMSKSGISDDSSDSGVISKLEHSPSDLDNEIECSTSQFGVKPEYVTFLNFNN